MARALYIHWPFCIAKCPYCDFNSHVRKTAETAVWKDALIADMRHEQVQANSEEPLTSIFFGGGTPSLMPPSLVAELIAEALWIRAARKVTIHAPSRGEKRKLVAQTRWPH